MKKISKIILVIALFVVTIFTACTLSNDDLAKQVIANMEQNELFISKSITVNSLVLVNKGGNEYSGVLETSEPNGNFTYSVVVVYDGDSFTWEIVE